MPCTLKQVGRWLAGNGDIHKFVNKYCLIARNLYSYGSPHVLDRVKGLLSASIRKYGHVF
jgi:hypothetical protein